MTSPQQPHEEMWLRFVDGRPVSRVTTAFLRWSCNKLEGLGKKALFLIWDNASWHISKAVDGWIREHNVRVKRERKGLRVVVCPLPTKSPWLNPIEPKWAHGKRRIVQADRILTAQELAQRVCDTFGCHYDEHLAITQKVS
ncbi:MAG: transposase [Dehalococcoidia bacterium]